MGAASTRLSLRPLSFEGHCFAKLGRDLRRDNAKPHLDAVIASRGLSSGAHSRDPSARNDGVGWARCLKF